MWKNTVGAERQHEACPLHAGYLRLQTKTQYLLNLQLFNENFACKKALQRTLSVLSFMCWVLLRTNTPVRQTTV